VTAGEPLPTGDEVYRNLGFTVFAPLAPGRILGDDIETTTAGGGLMTWFEVAIYALPDATDPTYRITHLALYDRCPDAGGTVFLDLLEGTPVEINERDAIFRIFFDLAGIEESIPERFWFGISFDTPTAGALGGAVPDIGISEDLIYVSSLSEGRCHGQLVAISNPYSALYANVFVRQAQPFFISYSARTQTSPQPQFDGGGGCVSSSELDDCGDGINLLHDCEAYADGVRMAIDECTLHSISMKVAGADGGTRDIEIELYTDDDGKPGIPIPNTRGCALILRTLFLEKIFFDYPGNVVLPRKFWVVLMDNDRASGPGVAGEPAEIGSSENTVVQFNRANGQWVPAVVVEGGGLCRPGLGLPCSSYIMTISCLGPAPRGACCDRLSGTCRNGAFAGDCEGAWEAESNCTTAPFENDCGVIACCEKDPVDAEETICTNKTLLDCVEDGGEPAEDGLDCAPEAECGEPACINAQGDCFSEHAGLGCNNLECCNLVCAEDDFCCTRRWDSDCVGEAGAFGALLLCGALAPLNNRCFEAAEIFLGDTNISTVHASRDGVPLPDRCRSFESITIHDDVWFYFVAPTTGTLTVDLCGWGDTNFDSFMAVYAGRECPAIEVLACNDDDCLNTFLSKLTLPVASGLEYMIRIGSWVEGGQSTGTVTLSLDVEGCPDDLPTIYVDPPARVVDARPPTPRNNEDVSLGIEFLTVTATPGADPACFRVDCETLPDPDANGIRSIVENPSGQYLIRLHRPISTGAVTVGGYHGTGRLDRFVLTSHPANVNGDGQANANDVTALRNCLLGTNMAVNCPHGLYSGDMNRSMALDIGDIPGLIEVLIGSDEYEMWDRTSLPSEGICAP